MALETTLLNWVHVSVSAQVMVVKLLVEMEGVMVDDIEGPGDGWRHWRLSLVCTFVGRR